MSSHPTLPPGTAGPAEADRAFAALNPQLHGLGQGVPPGHRRSVARTWEKLRTLGQRVIDGWIDENAGPRARRAGEVRDRAQQARTAARARARDARAAAEQAFDRLNPLFGVPADARDPAGHRAVQDREAALALGTRTAVAITRENDPVPLVCVAGQDDRVASAVRRARGRQGPERPAPER